MHKFVATVNHCAKKLGQVACLSSDLMAGVASSVASLPCIAACMPIIIPIMALVSRICSTCHISSSKAHLRQTKFNLKEPMNVKDIYPPESST